MTSAELLTPDQALATRRLADQSLPPFRPQRGGVPPLLAGRDEILERFSKRLNSRQGVHCLVLSGIVGAGKTALMGGLQARARAAGWQVVERSFASAGDDQTVAGLAEAVQQVGGQALQSPVLLACDDLWLGRAQSGASPAGWQAVLAAMQAAGSRGARLELVLAGAPRLESVVAIPHELERVGLLDEASSGRAVTEPMERTGLPALPPTAAGIIAHSTRGLPYAVQVFGDVLWQHAVAAESALTHVDVLSIRRAVLDRVDLSFFELPFDSLMPDEQELLQALAARGDGACNPSDLASTAGVQDVRRTLGGLVDQGWVYVTEDNLAAFARPLLGDYLRRRARSQTHAVRDLALVRQAEARDPGD